MMACPSYLYKLVGDKWVEVSVVVSNVEDDYIISTMDVAELVELVAKLMEEYNKRMSQVYRYYAICGQRIPLSIPSTSSIPSWQNE